MSLNGALSQSHLVDLEVIKDQLSVFLTRWRWAQTVEERALIESDAIDLLERILDFQFDLERLYKGRQPGQEEFNGFYENHRLLLQSNLVRVRALVGQFIRYFNSQQIALHHLIGKLRRVRQKRAALQLWSAQDSKYMIADHFLNLDYLDTTFTSGMALNVDTVQGILTLPVAGVEPVSIARVSIGSDSNGLPGNSDLAVTTNNTKPQAMISGDPNAWFDYERLDSGPLQLTLNIEFSQVQIINQLCIEAVNLGESQAFSVQDVLFTATSQETISLHDLTGDSVDPDRLVVKTAGNDSMWRISFLPVRAKSVAIKLVQNSSYIVQVANNNLTTTARKRWAIGIRKLGVNRVRYGTSGGINSINHVVPAGLYAAVPFLQIWPPTPDLYDFTLETSADGGSTWTASENVDDGIGSTVLLDGSGGNFLWRLGAVRNDAALQNAASFTPGEEVIPKTQSLLRVASRFSSPAAVTLPSSPYNDQVFVIQPRIARRGDRYRRLEIGRGVGARHAFNLPFNLVALDIDPADVTLYVNDIEQTYVSTEPSADGEWTFSPDYQQVRLYSVVSGGVVQLVLKPERANFIQRPDGFYHTMEFPFDSDKQNIKIQYLPRAGARHQVLLPRDRTTINLPHRNILEDSFELYSVGGLSYTEVASRSDVDSTREYWVDFENGVMVFNEPIGADVVRVGYTHVNAIDVAQENFDVVFDGPRPVGVRVAPSAFEAQAQIDTVGQALTKRYDLNSGAYEARTQDFPGSGNNAMTLSFERIVQGSLSVSADLVGGAGGSPVEVPFIDGRTEFLGLLRMDNETTTELTASGVSETVTFHLAAGALWDETLRPVFGNTTVFAQWVGSAGAADDVGEYHIDSDGLVTVNVGAGGTLPADIQIQYYYQDPNFKPENKYSVDYKRGVLYSYTDLEPDATISYKAAAYSISYDVGLPLSAKYDRATNTVSVVTENMASTNQNIKIIWRISEAQGALRDLAPYFSPIVELFGLRFT